MKPNSVEQSVQTIQVVLPTPHFGQNKFVFSLFKRIIVRAGRRGGKTVGVAIRAVERFLQGRRQLYAAPTTEQVGKFWFEVCRALGAGIQLGYLKKNESEMFIEKPDTEQRIKAKTAWNADMLRGDYADDLYLDEFQLMDEDTWGLVGAPMLLDNNGDAVFIYTPPSLRSAGVSKARDPRHAAKMFKAAQADTTGRWQAVHFTSHDNPYISKEALAEIVSDMSKQSYRQEILAEDDEIELAWLVYSKFNEGMCKIPRFSIPETWPIYSGHDFGSANPAALFIAEAKLPLPDGAPKHLRYGDYVCWHEYAPGGGKSALQHIDAFRQICGEREVMRSVGGNVTTEEEIRDSAYSAQGWPIAAPTRGRINAQIDRVIGLMELNKLFIFEDMYGLLGELVNCMWKLDNENRPTNKIKDESRYHLLACLRYIGSELAYGITAVGVRELQPTVRIWG